MYNVRMPIARRTGTFVAPLLTGALLAPAAAGADLPVRTECERPVKTGVGVTHRKNVSAKTACKVALRLSGWLREDGNQRRLYRCRNFKPVLRRETFSGWRLKVVETYELRLSRGEQSFRTSGTDFPLNCS